MSAELATAAVALLTPYLAESGKEAAKTLGKESAGAAIKALAWIREKLTERGQEALAELEANPEEPMNQDDLRTQLAKALAKHPELATELQELLAETRSPSNALLQTVGNGGRGIQFKGSGNTVSQG
jgi:phage shock protein A